MRSSRGDCSSTVTVWQHSAYITSNGRHANRTYSGGTSSYDWARIAMMLGLCVSTRCAHKCDLPRSRRPDTPRWRTSVPWGRPLWWRASLLFWRRTNPPRPAGNQGLMSFDVCPCSWADWCGCTRTKQRLYIMRPRLKETSHRLFGAGSRSTHALSPHLIQDVDEIADSRLRRSCVRCVRAHVRMGLSTFAALAACVIESDVGAQGLVLCSGNNSASSVKVTCRLMDRGRGETFVARASCVILEWVLHCNLAFYLRVRFMLPFQNAGHLKHFVRWVSDQDTSRKSGRAGKTHKPCLGTSRHHTCSCTRLIALSGLDAPNNTARACSVHTGHICAKYLARTGQIETSHNATDTIFLLSRVLHGPEIDIPRTVSWELAFGLFFWRQYLLVRARMRACATTCMNTVQRVSPCSYRSHLYFRAIFSSPCIDSVRQLHQTR